MIYLGYVGAQSADYGKLFDLPFGLPTITLGLLATLYYFAYFLVILPYLSKHEEAEALPDSLHQPIMPSKGARV